MAYLNHPDQTLSLRNLNIIIEWSFCFYLVRCNCRENWRENGATLNNNPHKNDVYQLKEIDKKEKL